MKGAIPIGVVGLGPVAQLGILPALARSPLFELKAISGPSRERLKVLSSLYGVEHASADWQTLLDRGDLQALVILADYREEILEAAIGHGLHILTVGPLSPTAAQAGLVREMVDAKGVVVQVAHLRRYDTSFTKAQRIFQEVLNEDDGRVLSLTEIRAPKSSEPADIVPNLDLEPGWAEKTFAAMDHATEEVVGATAPSPLRKAWSTLTEASGCISVLRGVLGKPREIVFVRSSPGGTFITAQMLFPGELMANLTVGRAKRPRPEEHMVLHGQQSEVSYQPPDPLIALADGFITRRNFEGTEESIRSFRVGPCKAVENALHAFATSIQDGVTPITGVHTAVEEQEILEGLIQKLIPEKK